MRLPFLIIFCFVFSMKYEALASGTPWLRLSEEPKRLLYAPGGRYVAYTSEKDGFENLHVLSLESRKIWDVGSIGSHPSLLWSPDGFRLFYRVLKKKKNNVYSELSAWDGALRKKVRLEKFSHRTGLLSFDPATWKIYLPFQTGVHSRQLRIQGLSPHADRSSGSYVVTPKGVLWVDRNQRTRYLREKRKKIRLIQSFELCPDGQCIVWATHAEEIYLSRDGSQPKQIGWGRDPKWSPEGSWIAFSGSRRVGIKTHQYDLRVVSPDGQGVWLTESHDTNERWPQWESSSTLIHSAEGSTDLYRLGLPVSGFFSSRHKPSGSNM